METNLINLIERYGDDAKCRAYLEGLRWGEGKPCCPRCGSDKTSKIVKRNQFDCDSCRFQFSVTAGSIFHDSHLPLWKWFLAVYLMIESKKGISANQLKRSLNVAYKTAWYLCHRIRKAMEELNAEQLTGTVEMDECYIGGRERGVGCGHYGANKTMVLGALQRGGSLRVTVEKRRKRATAEIVDDFVDVAVHEDAERLITDEAACYKQVADWNTKHETVNHSEEEWVRGDVHTNGIEGAWSLFKRSIIGSYHQVSTKHLDRYAHEFQWRYNNRKNDHLFRDTMLRLLNTPKMEFKELVAKA